ncbi:MAG TPA: helix-turn-helix transcriptional regulator, partial [Clostridia bacterium]|nr:helix-turn-helix transcriptional regulator [Clostridia bacterium]
PAFIHLYEILFLLSREKKGVIRDASHNPYVYKIINYINKYYSTIFTVDDIAEYCGVSKHHLCRVFKENMNMTIISFLNQAKVNNACKELVETDNQILQIALNNGFNSASYFNYVFKKQTGISPIEYRNIHTKKSK